MSMSLGLSDADAAALGPDAAVRIRTFRLILSLSQRLQTLMDRRLQADGLTTRQAALITAVDALGDPTLARVAAALDTTHQNARQVAAALERKGFLTIGPDPADRRAVRLRTTARSHEYWAGRNGDDYRLVLDWFADLDPDEASSLFTLLARVHRRTGTT